MILSSNPPVDLPIERLTSAQKWEVFQSLLIELDVTAEGEEDIPAWHLDVLAEREALYEAGKAEVMELDDFLKEARKMMP